MSKNLLVKQLFNQWLIKETVLSLGNEDRKIGDRVLCLRCKHFEGIDVEGYVYCRLRGRVKLMVVCPYFEEKKEEKKD